MSAEDRVKAAAKNVEGNVQEAFGKVTGDPEHEAEGKAKQAEAKIRNTGENLKDKAKRALD